MSVNPPTSTITKSTLNYAAKRLASPYRSHANQLIRTEFFNTHSCLHYELYEDVQYTGSFYTVEMWASQAHLDAHVKNQQSDMNKILPHLSEQLRISVIKPVK